MSIPLPFRQAGLVAAALVGSCLAAAPASAASIWTEVPSGTTQNITAIEYQSASRFWFTTAAGAIFKRQTDGSFAQVKTPSGVPLNDIEFSSGQIGFAVGNGGQVLRSTDGGNTWNPIPPQFASATDSTFMDCKQTKPLGDVNSVRFAGDNRVWIFAAGSQILTSQPTGMIPVGDPGTWKDANKDTHGTGTADDDTCRISSSYAEGLADAFFATPDVGYIVAGSYSEVFFTANNLVSNAQKKPADAGNAGSGSRVIAGDPTNPSRMWSVNARPYGRSTTAYTRDGWQSSEWFEIGNDTARTFPDTGPADVDYAGGTVLAAGDAGLVLNSTDGVKFFYNDAVGALATQRWNAVALASATDGAIGGDNGKLAITSAANFIPAPPAPPVVVADHAARDHHPRGHASAADVHVHRQGQRRDREAQRRQGEDHRQGQDQGPERRQRQDGLHRHGQHDDQEGQDVAHRAQREAQQDVRLHQDDLALQEQGRQREAPEDHRALPGQLDPQADHQEPVGHDQALKD